MIRQRGALLLHTPTYRVRVPWSVSAAQQPSNRITQTHAGQQPASLPQSPAKDAPSTEETPVPVHQVPDEAFGERETPAIPTQPLDEAYLS